MRHKSLSVLERRECEILEELHYVRQWIAYQRAINAKGKLKRNYEFSTAVSAQSPNLAQ